MIAGLAFLCHYNDVVVLLGNFKDTRKGNISWTLTPIDFKLTQHVMTSSKYSKVKLKSQDKSPLFHFVIMF